jgi:ferritin-like metal-binding protein YciE
MIKSGNKSHDDSCALAESFRQSAVRTAGVTQATVWTAEIAYYRSCIASAKVNGLRHAAFHHALWELGIRDV